ncbi:DUF6931 family protein [Frateuria hangzhouensis]|uniref:DUF6931 family protein n=1 Tax=Frateuria hangzhouensis TaxID=2995589 RepID=UPI002260C2C0|nr:hypothetical protein [Frateuria sp. STR12]MCX7514337.1 hypothetical protein [Frateuria sp. STR12]
MSPVVQAAEQMELAAPARARLESHMNPQQAVQALLAEGETQDALKLLARLLPKRYAVAWACQCARDLALPMEDKAGAALAEQWVREPDEAHRRAAFEFANAGGYRTIGAWLAASAGWSGGSLAPASQETAVPPAEHLTACAVVAAVNLMAGLETGRFEERRAEFMASAMSLLGAGSPAH